MNWWTYMSWRDREAIKGRAALVAFFLLWGLPTAIWLWRLALS